MGIVYCMYTYVCEFCFVLNFILAQLPLIYLMEK